MPECLNKALLEYSCWSWSLPFWLTVYLSLFSTARAQRLYKSRSENFRFSPRFHSSFAPTVWYAVTSVRRLH